MFLVVVSCFGYCMYVYELGVVFVGDVVYVVIIVFYEDQVVLWVFVEVVDVIIYEFENVFMVVLDLLELICFICFNCCMLVVLQDWLMEKNFLMEIGLCCVFYCNVEIQVDLL